MTGDSTQGRYFINTTTSTGTHPFSTGYYVLVNPGNFQLAFKYSGCEMKVRMYVNATWTNWVTYYTASEIDSKIKNPQTYRCNGVIFTGANIRGTGIAMVVITGNIAMIHFSIKVTTAGIDNTNFDYGISRNLLKNINANLPTITPILGGTMQIFNSNGVYDNTLTEYAGTLDAKGVYWTPARVYITDGSTGAWSETQFPVGTIITGTAFGTV